MFEGASPQKMLGKKDCREKEIDCGCFFIDVILCCPVQGFLLSCPSSVGLFTNQVDAWASRDASIFIVHPNKNAMAKYTGPIT